MIKHAKFDSLSPFIDSLFDRMQTPPHCDALVVLRERAMQEVMVTLACLGSQCTLTVSAPHVGVLTVAISVDECEQLRKSIPLGEVMELGAVFEDDVLDGESYLIKHVTSGSMTKSYLGNPRLCGLKKLQNFADSLDSFLTRALKMARRIEK